MNIQPFESYKLYDTLYVCNSNKIETKMPLVETNRNIKLLIEKYKLIKLESDYDNTNIYYYSINNKKLIYVYDDNTYCLSIANEEESKHIRNINANAFK